MKLPTIYELKPAFQGLLRPLVHHLANTGVTANQVTILAVVLSTVQGAWLYFHPTYFLALLFLPLVLFIRMALNAIDGMLAREFDQKSRLGGILNELADVVSDTVLYLPLCMHPAISPALMVLFVLLANLTEFTGVLAIPCGSERRYDGPMGKSDRAFLWGAVGFLAGIGLPLAPWINWVVGLSLILLCWTVLNRARQALKS